MRGSYLVMHDSESVIPFDKISTSASVTGVSCLRFGMWRWLAATPFEVEIEIEMKLVDRL